MTEETSMPHDHPLFNADNKPLSGRDRNERVKTICALYLGYKPRVLLGKGTAYAWVTVITRQTPDRLAVESIERMLLNERLCGTFPDDMGNGTYCAWRVARPKS
jgi:hypothetical protein